MSRSESRKRKGRPNWLVTAGCTIAGIIVTAIVWPPISQWLGSSPDVKVMQGDSPPGSTNPFSPRSKIVPYIASETVARNDSDGPHQAPAPITAEQMSPVRPLNEITSNKPQSGPTPAKTGSKSEDEEDDASDSRAAKGVAQLADLIEDVEHCVVRLDFESAHGSGCGSGFLVDKDGTIVTNYHVVEEVKSITATFNDNSKMTISGFKHVEPKKDLAVLQTGPPARPLPFLRLAKKIPRKGESVVAFGSPLGLSFSASEGIVSGIRTAKELVDLGAEVAGTWVQMTTQISPGNSGGPLVNGRGEAVGVNTMTLTAGQNLNFAISCDDVRMALDQARGKSVTAISPDLLPAAGGRRRAARPATEADLESSEDVHLARTDLSPAETSKFESLSTAVWFGVKWVDVVDFDARMTRGLPSRSGIVVSDVAYQSPAYRAGIKSGDVIRTINGKPASQTNVVEELIDEFKPGQSVLISMLRPESPGRYSKKDVTVRVESMVPHRMLDQAGKSEHPVEVRDFLSRHLLHYAATMTDAINSAGQAQKRASRTSPPSPGLTVKDLRKKSPFDPLFLPAFGMDVPIHVGNIGGLKRVQVLAVVGRKMVVARINRGLIALLADTSNLVEGELVNLGTAQIIGTVAVGESSRGRQVKVFVARPFVVDQYIPRWEAPRDE